MKVKLTITLLITLMISCSQNNTNEIPFKFENVKTMGPNIPIEIKSAINELSIFFDEYMSYVRYVDESVRITKELSYSLSFKGTSKI